MKQINLCLLKLLIPEFSSKLNTILIQCEVLWRNKRGSYTPLPRISFPWTHLANLQMSFKLRFSKSSSRKLSKTLSLGFAPLCELLKTLHKHLYWYKLHCFVMIHLLVSLLSRWLKCLNRKDSYFSHLKNFLALHVIPGTRWITH